MPLYEYECETCGDRVEVIQRIGDQPPTCHGAAMKKLLSAPAFQFKGSGWYVTDYAGKDASTAKSGGDAASGGEKADGGAASGGEKAPAKSASKDTAADQGGG